jgi:mRNA interferase MazF
MGMVEAPPRFQIWLVTLDPTRGSGIRKTWPCAVISADEMNRPLRTVIVAPMTTTSRPCPTRVAVRFQGKHGQIALDQIRTVDKSRLIRQMGALPSAKARETAAVLVEMFATD